MRSLVCTGLTLMGLTAALAPAAQAQAQAPAGYAPATMQVLDVHGNLVTLPVPAGAARPGAAAMPAPGTAAEAPHSHKGLLRGRTVCANCAKKEQAAMVARGPMMAERIVACAHSKNGVCASCQALLALPGAVTVGAPAPAPGAPAEAPGRALAMSGAPAGAHAGGAVAAVYDPSQVAEPAPIGVMQANYATNPAAAAAPTSIPTAASMQPGHAVAEQMGASPAPFQHKPTSSKNPHIIGHLLGFSGLGAEFREQRAQRKSEAHASIPYNNEGTTVNEVPGSVVYGRR